MALLEVKNVKKYFATQKAVDGASFNVEQGTIFGLLGPNGAGKTTLLRMITGIFYPDSGEITFRGENFLGLSHTSEIGYMPEERGLYKKMKIGEQAIYLAQLKGLGAEEANKQVKHWFVKLGMESWWGKKVEDLSKGMGQKLQFVTTVAHSPSLIILDEPFSGLDPVNANIIKEEIFSLARQGKTIIFSTHRMEQVEEICDKIVLVNKGKVILDGGVSEVKQQFKDNIYQLVSYNPINIQQSADAPYTIVAQSEKELRLKIKEGISANQLLKYFLDHDMAISNFNEVLPSLNDIFIKLVEGTATAREFQIL